MGIFRLAAAHLVTNQAQLENWYYKDKFSTRKIAKLLGTSQPTARKLLNQLGIKLRPATESPGQFKKGVIMSPEHRAKIQAALKANGTPKQFINPETGRSIRYNGEIRQCAFCGKDIDVLSIRKRNKYSFCDMTCHGKWRSENNKGKNNPVFKSIERPCAECGTVLLVAPNRAKKSKNVFCNHTCHDEWRSKHQTGATRYNWKGGCFDYYGESWKSARRAARKRDNDTCQECFTTKAKIGKNLDVHHRIPFRNFGVERHLEANALNNLICFCPRCHKVKEEFFNKYGVLFEDYSI